MNEANQRHQTCDIETATAKGHFGAAGVRLRFADCKAVWQVDEAKETGVVLSLWSGGVLGAHKHFETWEDLIRGKAEAV